MAFSSLLSFRPFTGKFRSGRWNRATGHGAGVPKWELAATAAGPPKKASMLRSLRVEDMVGNPIITWSPDMTVGDTALDNEHRFLLAEINKLQSISQSANRASVENCLAELATYAVKHFHNEESYMTKMRYSRLGGHRERHDAFTFQIQLFMLRLNSEDHTAVAVEIMRFLVGWWTHHILTDDKHYALEADF